MGGSRFVRGNDADAPSMTQHLPDDRRLDLRSTSTICIRAWVDNPRRPLGVPGASSESRSTLLRWACHCPITGQRPMVQPQHRWGRIHVTPARSGATNRCEIEGAFRACVVLW
jgi:hypothetical protein